MKKNRYLPLAPAVLAWIPALLLALGMGREARAVSRIIHVDCNAPGPTHDGISWTTAFTELQTALLVSLSGDEIWAAEGSYYPDYDPGSQQYTNSVSATFQLKSGVAVYGGFAGGESYREQRDWLQHLTVLSGDLDRNDISDPQGIITTTSHITGTNAWSVVSAYAAENAVLDGFAITGGNASYDPGGDWWEPWRCGGGMYISGTPELRNLLIVGNAALEGGGMFNAHQSSPTLYNITFSRNFAFRGGGMSNWSGRPVLAGAVFVDNRAVSGGGMYNSEQSQPELTNVTFHRNTSNYGGGIYNTNSSPTLTNCILWGNTASTWPAWPGTAQIYNRSGSPTISHSDIQDCWGSGAGWNVQLGIDGGGNIDSNPLFVDPAGGDLRLWLGSPAVDAGDNAAVPSGVIVDLDRRPRFVDVPVVPDSGTGSPPLVDMGAYEVQSNTPMATLEICTDETWYEPSTGQFAVLQPVGPTPGSVHDVPNAEPIWGQHDDPYTSTMLTRSFTIPASAASVTGSAIFVADDSVTLTLNLQGVGIYDAQTWPPPAAHVLTQLQPGENEIRATVYNRPSSAWFEACIVVFYQWNIYVPVVLSD